MGDEVVDDSEQTLWQRYKPVTRRSYEGDDRRAPPPFDAMKWLPLVLACIAGVSGYTKLQADVAHQKEALLRVESQHEKDMASYLGWNKAISERVRDIELQ